MHMYKGVHQMCQLRTCLHVTSHVTVVLFKHEHLSNVRMHMKEQPVKRKN